MLVLMEIQWQHMRAPLPTPLMSFHRKTSLAVIFNVFEADIVLAVCLTVAVDSIRVIQSFGASQTIGVLVVNTVKKLETDKAVPLSLSAPEGHST